MRIVLFLCAMFALAVGVATATAGSGNSANVKLCQKGGWATLVPDPDESTAIQPVTANTQERANPIVTNLMTRSRPDT